MKKNNGLFFIIVLFCLLLIGCSNETGSHTHKGGEATCSEQAICEVCNKPYGELVEHNYSNEYSYNDETHWNECLDCGKKGKIGYHLIFSVQCLECKAEINEKPFVLKLINDNEYEVVGISENVTQKDIIIPDTYQGVPVTSIASLAFYNNDNIENVVIPSSITNVSEKAFMGCNNLTIYCEATAKPEEWDLNWNYSNRLVVWGFDGMKVEAKEVIQIDSTSDIEIILFPKYAIDILEYKSSDESILTVDESGVMKGLKEGVVTVSVTIPSTTKFDYTFEVMVVKRIADLKGYTIKIAQDEYSLKNIDPFRDDYTKPDKEAKQKAWRQVEASYNCKIEVSPYPKSAPWGPIRWAYIYNQFVLKLTDYDFYIIPESKVADFVNKEILISLDQYYKTYGNDMMESNYVKSGTYKGELYTLVDQKSNIDSVMYYNIGLLEKLQTVDPTLQEPAQLFLDGNWSYETFIEYVYQAQNAMAKLYGDKGTANNENQEYYAISGWSPYWFQGLATNDGIPLADVDDMKIDITSENKLKAIDTVKTIYNSGCADPKQSVDGAVTSWNKGYSLFNTGNLWFVGDSSRWSSNAWGEDTRYGYVPWPSVNKQSPDEYKISVGCASSAYVMPVGRENIYLEYGEECNSENIYSAIVLMMQLTEEYYTTSSEYDLNKIILEEAKKYAHSEASQKAYIKVQELINNGSTYFDPLCTADNAIGSWYYGGETLRTAVDTYLKENQAWLEVTQYTVIKLKEALEKAYK